MNYFELAFFLKKPSIAPILPIFIENNSMGITFRLFAVGASSGGRAAITKFLSEIPGTINAAFVSCGTWCL